MKIALRRYKPWAKSISVRKLAPRHRQKNHHTFHDDAKWSRAVSKVSYAIKVPMESLWPVSPVLEGSEADFPLEMHTATTSLRAIIHQDDGGLLNRSLNNACEKLFIK